MKIHRINRILGFIYALYFICLVIFSLPSCSTTKSSKIKTNKDTSSDIQVKKSSETTNTTNSVDKSVISNNTSIGKTLEFSENEIGEVTGKLTLFDTSLPVDEKTGKPPAKSELTWTSRKESQKNTNQKENINTSDNRKNDLKIDEKNSSINKFDSKSNVKEKTKTSNVSTEKKFPNMYLILIGVIGAIVILTFVFKIPVVELFGKLFSLIQKILGKKK